MAKSTSKRTSDSRAAKKAKNLIPLRIPERWCDSQKQHDALKKEIMQLIAATLV